LRNLGLDVKTGLGGFGVVGILKGGKQGKKIAWRADMDGASYEYSDDVGGESSNKRIKHLCGHDVHTTIGLGIANVLSQKRQDLAGSVYFLFQPAEETQQGAKAMIDDGLFDLISPDEIYGLHIAPMETGVVSTMPGNVFSHARRIKINFGGTHDNEGLISAINLVVESLMRLKSKSEFYDLHNIVDPVIGIGSSSTVYKNYIAFYGSPFSQVQDDGVEFSTEVFVENKKDLDKVIQSLKQKIAKTKYANRLRSVDYFDEREGVNNNLTLVDESINALRTMYGETLISKNYGRMPFASEDFGHFQRSVPGVYFFMGASNRDLDILSFPHMPEFEVDELSIKVGVSYFSSLIVNRANSL